MEFKDSEYKPNFFHDEDLPPPIPSDIKKSDPKELPKAAKLITELINKEPSNAFFESIEKTNSNIKKDPEILENDVLEVLQEVKNIPEKKLPSTPKIVAKVKNNSNVIKKEMVPSKIKQEISSSIPNKYYQQQESNARTSSFSMGKLLVIFLLLSSFGAIYYYYNLNKKTLVESSSIKHHMENVTKELSKLADENSKLNSNLNSLKKENADLNIFKQKYEEEAEKNKKLDEENVLLRNDYKILKESYQKKKK